MDLDALAARGLHVVAYDARGHGRSGGTRDPRDYRWSSHAGDLLDFLDARGLSGVTVVGGSMGAGSALLASLARPRAIARLILRAPPPFGRGLGAARRLLLPLAFLYQILGTRRTAALVARLPGLRPDPASAVGPDLRALLGAQRRETIVPAIRGLLSEREPIAPAGLAAIQAPALVLAHRGDPTHPVASAEALRRSLPRAHVAIAARPSGWEEDPRAFADLLAAFAQGDDAAALALARLVDPAAL
jgi:pimeloyl-ACP methyl ester carboxylesterase